MITHDADAKRFANQHGQVDAVLEYRRRANRLIIMHTDVPAVPNGQELAGQLVEAAVGYAVDHDLTVVPICPFALSWLRRHPDITSHAAIDWPET